MTKQSYSQGSFQKKYIKNCLDIGEPLTSEQISALENTINQIFGARITEKPVSEYFDFEYLKKLEGVTQQVATGVYNSLELYVRNRDKIPVEPYEKRVEVTDHDALEFYQAVNPTHGRAMKVRIWGKKRNEALTKYLECKGLLLEKKHDTKAPI